MKIVEEYKNLKHSAVKQESALKVLTQDVGDLQTVNDNLNRKLSAQGANEQALRNKLAIKEAQVDCLNQELTNKNVKLHEERSKTTQIENECRVLVKVLDEERERNKQNMAKVQQLAQTLR